ncbi:hypothetical protein GQ44DRAFT_763712 [Phaeosphaeriaceae sp. PMI808]|nr:hypothetical protein GQ44DRAFT_763712 [Phaeosphaeriaceae sp. PMI808]
MTPVRRAQLVSEASDILNAIQQLAVLAFDAYSPTLGRPFVPKPALREYLTRNRIKVLLEYCNLPVLQCWQTIHDHYLAVFVILLHIGEGRHILELTPYDEFQDLFLPFDVSGAQKWSPTCRNFFHKFHDAQWAYCAQKLKAGGLVNKKFLSNKIIPFISKVVLKEGPDSIVFKVDLHSDYNSLVRMGPNGKPSTNTFILKSYRADKHELHYNEVRAYQMLSDMDVANNIVQFYGAWKHGDKFNILLELVQGGTLTSLFERDPPENAPEVLCFWTDLIRLLEPICRIHCHTDPEDHGAVVRGVHQDISPNNILLSSSIGGRAFKLVDFALTCFQRGSGDKEDMLRRGARGTQMFSAPECFRAEADMFIQQTAYQANPKHDIWSLGCVFSEALVWSMLGSDGIIAYRAARKAATNDIPSMRSTAYSGCFHDGNEVLETVRSMHCKVLQSNHLPQAYRHLVKSLIITIEGMLSQEMTRPAAVTVRNHLLAAISQTTDSVRAECMPRLQKDHLKIVGGFYEGERAGCHEHSVLAADNPCLANDTLRTATARQGSKRALPHADVPEVLKRVVNKKARIATSSTTPIREEYIKNLRGREQIFVIDNSESMRSYWKHVRESFEALSYVVKNLDPDGINLHFTNSNQSARSKHRTRLLTLLDEIEPGGPCNMTAVLKKVIDQFTKDRHSLSHSKSTGVSVYILTNGVWDDEPSSSNDVLKFITSDILETKPLSCISLQFIQFGNSSIGTRRLAMLDNITQLISLGISSTLHHTTAMSTKCCWGLSNLVGNRTQISTK